MSSDEVTRPDLPFVSRVHNLYRLMVPGIDQRIQDFFYFWAKHGPFPITIPETGGLRTDEAGQEELWNQGRTAPGPRAGDTGFPVLGLTVTAAKTLAQTPHGRGGAGDAEVAVVMNGRVIATLTDTRQPKIPIRALRPPRRGARPRVGRALEIEGHGPRASARLETPSDAEPHPQGDVNV